MTDHQSAVRRVALGTAIIGAAAFLLIAATRVPWHPVPGGMPAPVAADSVFTQAQIDRGELYALWARVWSWSSLAVSLAVATWLGFTDPARRWAERLRGWWWVRVVTVVLALTVVGEVVTLPFGVAFRRLGLSEGLAAGTWSAWGFDLAKGALVATVGSSIALIVLIGCMRRIPRLWPAVAGLAASVLAILGSFVYPIVVEPAFNNFTSMPVGELRSDVLALAKKEKVPIDDVLVADASRRTTTLNAYVSGFGQSRRVVLYDTLVDGASRDETLSVVAHELAHAKYDDVLTGTLLGAAGAATGVGLLGLILAGRRGPGDAVADDERTAHLIGAIPRVLALVAIATFMSAPIQNGISRVIETRADETALEVTNAPQAFIDLQRRLAVRSHADPTPPAWSQFWFGSHPTVLQRISLTERIEGGVRD